MNKKLIPFVTAAFVASSLAGVSYANANTDTSKAASDAFVFDHVNVIDVKNGKVLSDMTVVVQGDKVSHMGQSGSVQTPAAAQVVDAKGKYLIPGLWDMHSHIEGDKDIHFPLYLANGVTGVRDMGSSLWDLYSWQADEKQGKLMPEIISPGTTVDGAPYPFRTVVSNEEETRQAVRMLKERGADFIKAYDGLSRELYEVLVDEANKQGLPFVGHIPYQVSMAEASAAGQKSMEHLHGLFLATSSKEEELRAKINKAPAQESMITGFIESIDAVDSYDEAKANELYQSLIKNGTYITPTLLTIEVTGDLTNEKYANDPRNKYVPKQTLTNWNLAGTGLGELGGVFQRTYANALTYVKRMHDAGVPIMAGSDLLYQFDPYIYAGSSLHDELAQMVKAGLTPAEALQTATLIPAEYLGREKTAGTVEQGKEADLVLLNANPLEDINHVRNIDSVVVDGQLLDKSKLDNLSKQSEEAAQIASEKLPTADYIHVREIADKGGKIEWNAADYTVTIKHGKHTLVLPINQKVVTLDGNHITLWNPIVLVDGKTMIDKKILAGLLETDL